MLKVISILLSCLTNLLPDLFLLAGVDFNPPASLTGEFTVGGSSEVCFTFDIDDDDCVEDKESFEVVLCSSDSYVEIHISEANVTIWDNDCEWLCMQVNLSYYCLVYLQMRSLVFSLTPILLRRMLCLSDSVLNSWMVVWSERL